MESTQSMHQKNLKPLNSGHHPKGFPEPVERIQPWKALKLDKNDAAVAPTITAGGLAPMPSPVNVHGKAYVWGTDGG